MTVMIVGGEVGYLRTLDYNCCIFLYCVRLIAFLELIVHCTALHLFNLSATAFK